eukprot:4787042-Pleurochrysis_carterae.AAC.1
MRCIIAFRQLTYCEHSLLRQIGEALSRVLPHTRPAASTAALLLLSAGGACQRRRVSVDAPREAHVPGALEHAPRARFTPSTVNCRS